MFGKRNASALITAAFVICVLLARVMAAKDLGAQLGCKNAICSYLVKTISLYGGTAEGLAVDGKGNLYIAENVNNQGIMPQGPFVLKVDAKGVQTVVVPAGVLGDVTALAFDGFGDLYIADGNGCGRGQPAPRNQVWELTNAGKLTPFIQVTDPSGLAFDQQGNLYVSSWSDGAVYKFSPTGRLLGTPVSGLPADSLPYGVAVDRADNLYVAGFGSTSDGTSASKIFKVTPTGSVSVFVEPPLPNGNPESLVFDSRGNLYAGYYHSLKILRIAPDGSYVTFPGGGIGPDAPNGMAIDHYGDLFVAVNGGRTTARPAVVKLRRQRTPSVK